MKINAGEIRVGMLIEYKNELWQVLKTQHVKPGKGGAFAQVEMKSMNKNTKLKNQINDSYFQLRDSVEEKLILTEEKIKSKLSSDVQLVQNLMIYQ